MVAVFIEEISDRLMVKINRFQFFCLIIVGGINIMHNSHCKKCDGAVNKDAAGV